MRPMLSRLWPSSHALERAAATLLVLVASYQFGVAASDGRHRTTEFALLVLVGSIYWHDSIVRRRASRDVAAVLAGLAEVVAAAFRRDSGVLDVIGRENFFMGSAENPNLSTRKALQRAQQILGTRDADIHIFYDPRKHVASDI